MARSANYRRNNTGKDGKKMKLRFNKERKTFAQKMKDAKHRELKRNAGKLRSNGTFDE
jgi:hypothetical protein